MLTTNWIEQIYEKASKNFNKDLVEYGEIINRFLNNEVDIFWEGDTIMVKELDPLDKQTSGE